VLDAAMPSTNSSTLSAGSTYDLPREEQVSMAHLANHLAKREAEMPLRRRIASYLSATNQASTTTR
jgi:hypothetical protein